MASAKVGNHEFPKIFGPCKNCGIAWQDLCKDPYTPCRFPVGDRPTKTE